MFVSGSVNLGVNIEVLQYIFGIRYCSMLLKDVELRGFTCFLYGKTGQLYNDQLLVWGPVVWIPGIPSNHRAPNQQPLVEQRRS